MSSAPRRGRAAGEQRRSAKKKKDWSGGVNTAKREAGSSSGGVVVVASCGSRSAAACPACVCYQFITAAHGLFPNTCLRNHDRPRGEGGCRGPGSETETKRRSIGGLAPKIREEEKSGSSFLEAIQSQRNANLSVHPGRGAGGRRDHLSPSTFPLFLVNSSERAGRQAGMHACTHARTHTHASWKKRHRWSKVKNDDDDDDDE